MKKLVTIMVTLCLLVGVSGGTNDYVQAKEASEDYAVEAEPYTQDQKEQLENANHVFSEEELRFTPYTGQHVEVINGNLYVEGRIVWSIVIWMYVSGIPKILGWMAAGGVVKLATNKIISAELKQQVKSAWNRYSDMTDAYADENQKLKSVKRSSGVICVVRPNGKGYDCSMR